MPKVKNTKEVKADGNPRGTEKNPTRTSAIHYDYIMNGYELSPNYIQNVVSRQKVGAIGAGGYGAYRFQENPMPITFKKLFPHNHPFTEYFIFYSTDPDNIDDISGTTEFWLGEGKDAEPYIITKPTIIVVPPNLVHLPEIYRGFRSVNAQTVVYSSPLWSVNDAPILHPDLNVHKKAKLENFSKKYQNLVNVRDISKAALFPAHKGKSQVMLHHDIRHNLAATHHIEVNLISGSGIGWGCGDMMHFPDYKIRSLPHIHDALETYIFIGTDPDHPEDLGGTIQFWIGEGAGAKKIVINKPTTLLIPPNTVHLPMYVSELHNPIITTAILDTPLWSVLYTDKFPAGFKYESKPKESSPMKFQLIYNKEKCKYPKCHLCVDQCQVSGIDLTKKRPVVGEPCLQCGQCAVLCPSEAITVKVE
jgi:ferredoxin